MADFATQHGVELGRLGLLVPGMDCTAARGLLGSITWWLTNVGYVSGHISGIMGILALCDRLSIYASISFALR